MNFKQILALVFALSLGYGLGQQGGRLWATPYPTGGGGTANVLTNTNGQQGINNIDAANEEIQRGSYNPVVTDGTGSTIYLSTGDSAISFGEAFSAAPIVLYGGSTATLDQFQIIKGITTSDFDTRNWGDTASEDSDNQSYLAIGD